MVVLASAGGSDEHPGWYRNLVANPAVGVQPEDVVRPMTSRTTSDKQKEQIWPGIVAKARNFEGHLVTTSPNMAVVILEPRTGWGCAEPHPVARRYRPKCGTVKAIRPRSPL
jgi:deazaflavin-dependent oxidoreductase (nitroreductase family)